MNQTDVSGVDSPSSDAFTPQVPIGGALTMDEQGSGDRQRSIHTASDSSFILHPSSFDIERIRASGLVGDLELHAEISSTNDRAAQIAQQERLQLPVLVLTERQISGRGRGSNRWWSGPGALTFSLLFDARQIGLAVERWPQVALASGLAVCDALREHLPNAAIGLKWPNDVYLNGKKVSGILVECPAASRPRLVVGIGLNVNNALRDAPVDLQQHATSMTDVAGRTFDITAVLLSVLRQLFVRTRELVDGAADIFHDWRGACLLTGKAVRLCVGAQEVSGRCRGIDEEGRLVLATADGVEHYRAATVVSFGDG
jgi:BirA family transcriptional regulator, biotin operon repressor / biotin---[acetyl-CoA-carboxylase] ligase